jgi:NADH-quinone oxidoreductase subunit C
MAISSAELRARLAEDLPATLDPDHTPAAPPVPPPSHTRPLVSTETEDVLVRAEAIPIVVAYCRETLGYTLLSNITAVDYLHINQIELVYHLLHLAGGPPLVIKTRVPRNGAVVPSLTGTWPGADLQEREAFDLYGVVFSGHASLTRIYMWDEFDGHPMRKDFPRQGDKY